MSQKPFSQACENNRGPILQVLKRHLTNARTLLEVGTGTGQHAVYFAENFPNLRWQTSDLVANHAGIRLWLQDYRGDNIQDPLVLDVSDRNWPVEVVDSVFTANSLHIMSWQSAQRCIQGAARVLTLGGLLIIYGPFNYDGCYTSESNAQFDQWLKARSAYSGIRDHEKIVGCAAEAGMALLEDNAMPANNRCLVFQKIR